ncbi:hypothetical protein [Streptomyces sp. NPDC060065]|uniref:hypothetical protein n=1 Tax=Streptomyces sp. NPDC060065 TaxID=3347050 RepID=UPI0036B49188
MRKQSRRPMKVLYERRNDVAYRSEKRAENPLQQDPDTTTPQRSPSHLTWSYENAPTRSVSVHGEDFAYRELGPEGGTSFVYQQQTKNLLVSYSPKKLGFF